MENKVNPTAQKLMESFKQFKKLHFKQKPIEGLKHNEVFVLFSIKKRLNSGIPGIKVSELSRILKVTAPTVTQVITALEKEGYVHRSMDEKDRRAVRINLTDKGENFVKRAYEDYMDSFYGLVEYLGEEKSNELADLLSKVFVYFNEIRESKF